MTLSGLEIRPLGRPARSQSLYRLCYLLSSPRRPDRFWGPHSLLSNGYRGKERPGREAAHSPPTSAEVKKTWIYASTPLYAFMAQCLIS
jgi:hypothetical protein